MSIYKRVSMNEAIHNFGFQPRRVTLFCFSDSFTCPQMLNKFFALRVTIVASVWIGTSALTTPDYSDLPPGPYCANLPFRKCCIGRQDNCSAPILGTECYCDDFCWNRPSGSPDCCPDYWSHCAGIEIRDKFNVDDIENEFYEELRIDPVTPRTKPNDVISRFDSLPPGSYCSKLEYNKCCEGRDDDCAIPLDGTMCYCDKFCSNRTSSEGVDCCPDYWSHCEGLEMGSQEETVFFDFEGTESSALNIDDNSVPPTAKPISITPSGNPIHYSDLSIKKPISQAPSGGPIGNFVQMNGKPINQAPSGGPIGNFVQMNGKPISQAPSSGPIGNFVQPIAKPISQAPSNGPIGNFVQMNGKPISQASSGGRNDHSNSLPSGIYCSQFNSKKCCEGRNDNCHVLIGKTACYCDDFCANRTIPDCCPDYWSHCEGQGMGTHEETIFFDLEGTESSTLNMDDDNSVSPTAKPISQAPSGGPIRNFVQPTAKPISQAPSNGSIGNFVQMNGKPISQAPSGGPIENFVQMNGKPISQGPSGSSIGNFVQPTAKPISQASSGGRNGRFNSLPPGIYCSQFQFKKCCEGRNDNCHVLIGKTPCYCDDFCANRTIPDCCPDYWSHCSASNTNIDGDEMIQINMIDVITSPPKISARSADYVSTTQAPKQCFYEGKYYEHGQKLKKNCNTCSCSTGSSVYLCEMNRCLIEPELLQKLNSHERNLHWHADNQTKFWGRTLQEGIQLRLGTKISSEMVYKMKSIPKTFDSRTLPRQFDARSQWPKLITGIKDQGWCGASWAISTASVASDRYALMSNGTERPKLSAQHLLSCNKKKQRGCDGGRLDHAWNFMRRKGLVDESCYPWSGKNDECRFENRNIQKSLKLSGCQSPKNSLRTKELYEMGPAYRLVGEEHIMLEIITSGPVQATMKVNPDFFLYKNGIYRDSRLDQSQQFGYHSIRILGWGEEGVDGYESPEKFWIVANSWGTDWGENGYFRIRKGTNECEIESFVLASLAPTE